MRPNDPRAGLRGVVRSKRTSLKSQEEIRRKKPWTGKVDEGVYAAIHEILDELGFNDLAWWQLSRSSDIEFRKEGRAIVQPSAWDEFAITAPRNGIILLTQINFTFPEPIGREFANITVRHPRQDDVNKISSYQSKSGGGGVIPTTIYDTMLHHRFMVERGQSVYFRIENTNAAAQAIVDFSLVGRIIGGGYFPHQV